MAISNKDVEVLSEALFCYYFAIYKNKKEKKYRSSIWNQIKTSSDLPIALICLEKTNLYP